MISDLVERFHDLQTRLAALVDHLQHQQPNHWVPLQGTDEQLGYQSLSFANNLIADLWYRDQQDGRETRSRHGLILATADTREMITAVNQAKDDFRAAVNLEKQNADNWKARYEQLCEAPAPLREQMALAGLTRIHLKQCFRHLPLLPQRPDKVGFSWYVNGRSIKKLTLQQAEKQLLDLGEDKTHIQIQLQKLGQLTPGTVLAQVQTLAPVVRANLVFDADGNVSRKSMNVSLPVFVPANQPNDPLPNHNTIAPEPPEGRTRQARGDNRISDEPWLPSIRAYLYR